MDLWGDSVGSGLERWLRCLGNQGDEGAPEASIRFSPGSPRRSLAWLWVTKSLWLPGLTVQIGTSSRLIRGMILSTRLLGVFSTRSPDRPNPIGLHRVRILDVRGLRILVDHLEAVDRITVPDVNPVLDPTAER